jgi:hypothetical protein
MASTTALTGSTEEAQFNADDPRFNNDSDDDPRTEIADEKGQLLK